MIRRYGTQFRALAMFVDIGVIALIALVLSELMVGRRTFWERALPDPRLGLLLYVSASVAILWLHGGYRLRTRWSIASEARVILHALSWMALATLAFLYVTRLQDVSRTYLLALFTVQFAATLSARWVLRMFLGRLRRRGRNMRHMLVLGTGPAGQAFARKISEHPEIGLEIVGFLGDPVEDLPQQWRYLGPAEALHEVIHTRVVDEVAVCLMTEDWELVQSITALCEAEGKIVRMPVPMPHLSIATGHVEDLEGTPVLSLLSGPNEALALALKRGIDVVASAAGMIVLAPLFLAIAAATHLSDRGAIFYRQERVGLNGRRFRVVKFRSMVPDADSRRSQLIAHNEINGHAFKMTSDPRVTRVGRFLRRSSLDELPQLWNVLVGEMSLVGPRPPLPDEVAGYDVWHRRRLSMKPGITGLWQIEGRHEREFDQWVQKDLEYIDHWSPWLDIRILLRTIPAVLRAEGR